MNIVERTELAARMWALLIPIVAAPADPQLARWAMRFSDAEMEKVFAKVGRKLNREGLQDRTDLDIWRYTTACLLNAQSGKGCRQ